MNGKTQKLRAKVFQALEDNAYETEKIEAILQACKEAGLRFVDLPTGFTDEGIVEIEL